MKSLSSAIIISDNFIVSVTLTEMLKKIGVKQIDEVSINNSLSDILITNPGFIFIDLKYSDSKLFAIIKQLSVFPNARIAILTNGDSDSQFESHKNSFDEVYTLSKPLSETEIEQFLIKMNTEFFYGKSLAS